MPEYILELRGISKLFPGVRALDDVDFQLRAGEIHALMGENGAGKSTLIKIIPGVHQPDSGEFFPDGKKVSFASPRDASAEGVAVIISMSHLIRRRGVVNEATERSAAKELAKRG